MLLSRDVFNLYSESTQLTSLPGYAHLSERLKRQRPDPSKKEQGVTVTLRLAVYRQSFRLGVRLLVTNPPPANIFCNWTLALIVLMWHPLWLEDRCVVYNCCWSSPVQSFSGPSQVGLRPHFNVSDSRLPKPGDPVFISPRNWVVQLHPPALSSLFVASYDSQGYGGGIRPRLHTGTIS
jgi:hypothetical protein